MAMNEAQTLIEYLKQSGFSQVQIARFIKSTTVNISRIVHGERSGVQTVPKLRRMASLVQQAKQQPPPVQAQSQPRPSVRSPQVVSSSPAQYLQYIPPRLTAQDILKRVLPGRREEVREEESDQTGQVEQVYYEPGTIPPNWPIGVPLYDRPQPELKLAWGRLKR
jgi:transcriptional regulator with XRE-family HTH domain